MKYVHDPKAVAEANEPTSWRSTVPIPHLEIPPNLQPTKEPEDGDLCVFAWRESYAIFKCSSGSWFKRADDPRIVGAVCAEAWVRELSAFGCCLTQYEAEVRTKWAAHADEQARAWRRYAEGK